MAKSRRRVYISELVKADHSEFDEAFTKLRRHLKSGTGSPYQSKPNYLTAIFDLNNNNTKMISEIKFIQWRIINYSILLFIAVIGALQITNALFSTIVFKFIITSCIAISLSLIYFVAIRMMNKTNEDLDFYREHSKLNEEMLDVTLGLPNLINNVVSSRRPEFKAKHDFEISAFDNRMTFTIWLYRILAGSFILSFLVSVSIIWLNILIK
jgi:hypothetical protein